MKEITITSTATVINKETWVATVPDDFNENNESAIAMLFTDDEHDMDLQSEEPQITLERNINSVKVV